MEQRERSVRPVAVVAMGNPQMSDDGVAIRVMGRVRPILGEIALLGSRDPVTKRSLPRGGVSLFDDEPRAWLRSALRPAAQAALASPSPRRLSAIVEWVEGRTDNALLRSALQDRQRVVLLDTVCHGASPGHVQHWHMRRDAGHDLNLVEFYQPIMEETLEGLPFWLEDDVPNHGTDLIAIEPYRIEPGPDLTPVIRSRLAAITSQVAGLLLRILEEEGWRFEAKPARRRGGKAADPS